MPLADILIAAITEVDVIAAGELGKSHAVVAVALTGIRIHRIAISIEFQPIVAVTRPDECRARHNSIVRVVASSLQCGDVGLTQFEVDRIGA